MTELEPVAYAAFEPNGHIRIWSQNPGNIESYDITPLVRLSSAQSAIAERDARIAELEAEKELLLDMCRKASADLGTAGELAKKLTAAREAIRRYGDRMRMSFAPPELQQEIDAAFSDRAARSLMSKIGERNGE